MKRIAVAVVVGILASCGSSGRVVLELTDAPPDTENMSRVMVTLSSVQAHVADGSEAQWQDVPLEQHEFDLLALQNDVTAALGELAITGGMKVTQLRMILDVGGRNEIILRDGRVCRLGMRDVDPTGVTLAEPFEPLEASEGTLKAVLDFDVRASLQRDDDCRYRLTPVITLKRTSRD